MGNRLRKTVTLLAFTAFSTAALADDPPARVGRVALAEGQVSISQDTGQPAAGAQVNWPVTSHNTISTAPGARTELRIGSTSVRLDGGSALEVTELDDDNLRLRLHYGRASVRIVNADVVGGFELVTPQARVHLQQPGRIRIDADAADTSVVSVFDGVALVEGGGSELTLRAGRRADVRDDGIRTVQAQHDAFDDWSLARDQYEDRSQSTRYVASEVTGYEDLDRYGSWRTDAQYGSLWVPTVGADWVPYRDGSWTWIEPWGWTWVDNAPWGYAPFHYGRWLYVNHRWCWTPGHLDRRPIWAPALVGWVGGGWNTTFHGHDKRPLPATGWYPLGPHDRYVPGHHAPAAHLNWWNRNVHDDGHRDRNYRPNGVTVVPHDAFGQRDRVDVGHAPKGATPPALAVQQPGSAPPPPRGAVERDGRRGGWRDRDGRDGRDGRGAPVPVLTAPSVQAGQPQARPPVPAAVAAPAPVAVPQGQGNEGPHGRQGREAFEDGRGRRQFDTDAFPRQRPNTPPVAGTSIASPPLPANVPPAGTSIASPPLPAGVPAAGTTIGSSSPPRNLPPAGMAIGSAPMPAGTPAAGTSIASPRGMPPAGTSFGAVPTAQPQQERFVPRFERPHRDGGEFEHRGRETSAPPPQAVAAPAPSRPPMPAAQPAPMPVAQPAMAAPAPRPMPAPPSVAAPAPAPAPAQAQPQRGGDRGDHDRGGRDGRVRQQDR
jgi:hypothetical protein